jgi:UPF0755 protein
VAGDVTEHVPATAAPPGAPPGAPRAAPRGADRRARYRRRRLVVGAIAAVVLLVVGFVAWFLIEAYPIGGPGPPVVLQVTTGESVAQIADALAAKGVIGSALAFRLDLAVAGTPAVQAGWYELPTSSSFSAVRAALGNGPNATVVDVATGESSLEVAQALAGAASGSFGTRFLSLVRNGSVASPFQPRPHASLEGLLAPGTYVLAPGETPRQLVATMARAFVARAASVGLTPSTHRRGLDAYQLVTAASIVEKEGYYARNMPRVATVLYNRLARGMPLQMDATVLYATGQDGGTVTHATERIRSPYNTYLHAGLTPTPICVPSTQALTATLHPATGPWLFFTLVDRSGTLAFSTTIAEQLANERLAQRRGV